MRGNLHRNSSYFFDCQELGGVGFSVDLNKRSPDLSLLMFLGSQTKPSMHFCMANVESLERDLSSSPDIINRNRGNMILAFFISVTIFVYLAINSASVSSSDVIFCSAFFLFFTLLVLGGGEGSSAILD